MPVTWTIESTNGHVHVTVMSPYTRDQVQAVAAAIASHPAFAIGHGFLIDAIGTVGPAFVRDVETFFITNQKRFAGARVAVVVNLQSELKKDQRAPTEPLDVPVTLRVFRSYKVAERWLSEKH
jgi:hypothetical protein